MPLKGSFTVNQVKSAKGVIQWKSKGLLRHANSSYFPVPLPVSICADNVYTNIL